MTRQAGDPGPVGWLRFAYGFRMPDKNIHWVRHELTDAGWRWRTVLRPAPGRPGPAAAVAGVRRVATR